MTRNTISPDRVPGSHTFLAPVTTDVIGEIAFSVQSAKLGDHAHIHIWSGRAVAGQYGPEVHGGKAGKLVLRWDEWLVLRELLDSSPRFQIREADANELGAVHVQLENL